MRRLALICLIPLSACSGSGFWRYERDTLTRPGLPFIKGANPNMPVSSAENYQRSANGSGSVQVSALTTEAGDIWPGPPPPVPTLKDLQKQQTAEINNTGSGLSPLPPLPSLPGFDIAQQDPGRAPPASALGNIPGRKGGFAIPNVPTLPPGTDTTGNAPIVVPNGNGTSTVINPNGTVTTIPTPGK